MFKKKNSKYHSILQSIKKNPSKSNLATRHEEITTELENNKKKVHELNNELKIMEQKITETTNISEKNSLNLKMSDIKSKIQQLSYVRRYVRFFG